MWWWDEANPDRYRIDLERIRALDDMHEDDRLQAVRVLIEEAYVAGRKQGRRDCQPELQKLRKFRSDVFWRRSPGQMG